MGTRCETRNLTGSLELFLYLSQVTGGSTNLQLHKRRPPETGDLLFFEPRNFPEPSPAKGLAL
jgi:hypothetical protein